MEDSEKSRLSFLLYKLKRDGKLTTKEQKEAQEIIKREENESRAIYGGGE
jgi:hypothetical protein